MMKQASQSETLMSSTQRLLSLDALRGFDMFWIMGGDQLVHALAKTFDWPWLQGFSHQMHHPGWGHAFRAYDLIFPLFLFIAGVAIPFSIGSMISKGFPKWKIHLRIIRRFVLLIILGVIYNGGLRFSGYENTRFASVLGLIGVGYFFASMIVLHFKLRWQVILFFAILLGYWAALSWIPVPGYGAGVITAEGSFSSFVDQKLLPGDQGLYDPEGIMSCISGICVALGGAFTGQWLRKQSLSKWYKALGMLGAGIVCVLLALLWGKALMICKEFWSGSFVLLCIGCSLLLLSVFYTIIDCIGLKKWSLLFTVIGVNSITIYLAGHMIDFSHTSNILFQGLIKLTPEPSHLVLSCISVLAIKWLSLYLLYRKKIFLKL